MHVVGAGLGRTGTTSLKLALETLLGEPCYHMYELMNRQDDVAAWQTAADGGDPDWHSFLAGWGAAVDWPASGFYRELAHAYPEAKILLSERDGESWWRSAERTIFAGPRENPERLTSSPIGRMVQAVFARAGVDPQNKDVSIAAFDRHNAQVRDEISSDRLIVWRPGDGWEPLCRGLGLPTPAQDFPHSNSSASFGEVAQAASRGEVERIVPPPPLRA